MLLDGKKVSDEILTELNAEVSKIVDSGRPAPHLALVKVRYLSLVFCMIIALLVIMYM